MELHITPRVISPVTIRKEAFFFGARNNSTGKKCRSLKAPKAPKDSPQHPFIPSVAPKMLLPAKAMHSRGLLASLNLTYRFIYTPKNEGISNKRWEETIPNSWRSLGRRWWQLKDFLNFYPEPWGFMIQVD